MAKMLIFCIFLDLERGASGQCLGQKKSKEQRFLKVSTVLLFYVQGTCGIFGTWKDRAEAEKGRILRIEVCVNADCLKMM